MALFVVVIPEAVIVVELLLAFKIVSVHYKLQKQLEKANT